MAITAIISDQPFLAEKAETGEPDVAQEWRLQLAQAEYRAWKVVPTSRRRRIESITEAFDHQRIVQQRRVTLAELIRELTGFCRVQYRLAGNVEQTLRMARILADSAFRPSAGLIRTLLGHRRQAHQQAVLDKQNPVYINAIDKYTRGLQKDQVWDSVLQMQQLVKEINDADSPLSNYLRQTITVILFDGFYQFSPAEAEVIASLGKRVEIRLWMHGHSNRLSRIDTIRSLDQIGVREENRQIDSRPLTQSLALLGQALFTRESGRVEPSVHERLKLVQVPQKKDEFTEVAIRLRNAFENQGECNPGDFAIVVPGPMEARLCRIELEKLGIPCYAPAEILQLAESRPARIVLMAMEFRSGKISHRDLMELLLGPLVRQRLHHPRSLMKLRELGSGFQGRQTPEEWVDFWQTAIDNWANHIRNTLENIDWVEAEQNDLHKLARSAGEILKSLVGCLQALRQNCPDPGPTLAQTLSQLLAQLRPDEMLDPTKKPGLLAAREMQEDQLAWNNIKDMLTEIHDTPARWFPSDPSSRHWDWLQAIRLGLQSETFALAASDHGKVQILRPLALRGSQFQSVYWVGLNQDEYPATRRTGTLDLLPEDAYLREQEYYFSTAFQSARQELVLIRSERNGDEHFQPGPFWNQVQQQFGSAISIDPPLLRRHPVLVRRSKQESLLPSPQAWVADHQRELHLDLPLVGTILSQKWSGEKEFSPTKLETYYRCPFRFFAENTLGLKLESEDRKSMIWGTVLHKALENALEKGRPLPHRLELLQKTLQEALAEKQRFLEPFHSHQAIRSAHLITSEKIVENLGDFLQLGAEVVMRNFELGSDSNGVPVRIRGRIDLVAIHKNQDLVTIIDYKTGKLINISNKIASNRFLQPGLYALFIQKQEYAQDKNVAAAYLLIQRNKVSVKGSDNFPGQNKRYSFPLNLDGEDGPRQAALKAAEGIRQGVIALTIHGPDKRDSECTSYCPARHACRHRLTYKP